MAVAVTASRPDARITRPSSALLLAGAGLIVVVLCSLVARGGAVGAVERWVFAAINGLPDWLRWPMWLFQLLGLLLLPVVVAAGALLLRYWQVRSAPTCRTGWRSRWSRSSR